MTRTPQIDALPGVTPFGLRDTSGEIVIMTSVTEDPDFGGLRFYVEAGGEFDASDYASAYKLNRSEITDRSIKAAQDEASRLYPGQWLLVSHRWECRI